MSYTACFLFACLFKTKCITIIIIILFFIFCSFCFCFVFVVNAHFRLNCVRSTWSVHDMGFSEHSPTR